MSALYIHIPFCKKRCIYCSFYSSTSNRLKEPYLDALQQEIKLTEGYLEDKNITTLYFGGGTPSLLSVKQIETLLQKLRQHYSLELLKEFTFEVNPESVDYNYFKDLLSIGVNRISMGIQSFQPHVLQFLDRAHTEKMAHQAIENSLKAGFTNISADLIYGITVRQPGEWVHDVEHLLQYPIPHISAYALTIEENTQLAQKYFKGSYPKMEESNEVEEWQQLIERLAKHEISPYEISNYAKKGFESKHNSSYWERVPYLGLGPSAHSFNGVSRKWNVAHTQTYIDAIAKKQLPFESEQLDAEAVYIEKVMLGLRRSKGIDLRTLTEAEKKRFLKGISTLNSKYYAQSNSWVYLTFEGLTLLDFITSKITEY